MSVAAPSKVSAAKIPPVGRAFSEAREVCITGSSYGEPLRVLVLKLEAQTRTAHIWLNRAVLGDGAPSNSMCSMRTWS